MAYPDSGHLMSKVFVHLRYHKIRPKLGHIRHFFFLCQNYLHKSPPPSSNDVTIAKKKYLLNLREHFQHYTFSFKKQPKFDKTAVKACTPVLCHAGIISKSQLEPNTNIKIYSLKYFQKFLWSRFVSKLCLRFVLFGVIVISYLLYTITY